MSQERLRGGIDLPASALRNKLFFDQHERAEFQHAHVLKKTLLVYSSALNGTGNEGMA
jgi:hypothetical protein